MTPAAYSKAIDDYASAVVVGDVPAGKYHRLACARHLRDRAREGTPAFPYRFDGTRVQRICEFVSHLKHYKGEWAGQFIRLEPWQVFIEGSIGGWVRADGIRRSRMVYIEIPRKNGKTLIFACNGLYFTFFDGEPGAEGYFAAMKRDQSMIAFTDGKKLVQSSGLKSRIKVKVGTLHRDETSSKLQPLGADADSLDGLNPHFIGLDEYHAQKNRSLPDVLETAMGSRRQPIMQKITTAGDDPVSPCGDEHDYACKILDQVIEDETYFAFIAHADTDDDWQAESTWKKANPNYGISVKVDDMRALATKAKNMPSAAATFQQKRLNWWVNASAPCLSVDGWRQGQTKGHTPESWLEFLRGRACFVGADLASKIDLMALAALFPPTVDDPKWRLVERIWSPADTLADRAHRDRAPYLVWRDQGWLQAPAGTSLDTELVRETILAWREVFTIRQIGFDPWHADTPIKNLIARDGFTETEVVEVPQTFAGMSAGCLRLQSEILGGQVDAGGCPVTAWAVSNTVDQRDGKDNMMFIKKKSRGRIDPVIAAAIALSLAIRQEAPPETPTVHALSDYL